jgi:hypothetical protein
VRLFTDNVTSIDARKPLVIDSEGFHIGPAEANCNTCTNIRCVAARMRLARRIAWKRAHQQKCEAEQIAARRVERRIKSQMEDKTAEMVQRAKERFKKQLLSHLLPGDVVPRTSHVHTTDDHLHAELLQADPYQLAAPDSPPPLSGDHDLAIRIHESVLGNFAARLLRGETLSDEGLASLMEEMTGEVPEELRIDPDKAPWTIEFADHRSIELSANRPIELFEYRPVTAVFDGGHVTLTITGSRFSRGDQGFDEPLEITARYKLEQGPTGAKWTREGKVGIAYPRHRQRPGLRRIALKAFFQKKFAALFKPEFVGEGLVLKGRWEKAGALQLRQLSCDGGWFVAGWEQPSGDAPAPGASE